MARDARNFDLLWIIVFDVRNSICFTGYICGYPGFGNRSFESVEVVRLLARGAHQSVHCSWIQSSSPFCSALSIKL
jgi:hypothetical protein